MLNNKSSPIEIPASNNLPNAKFVIPSANTRPLQPRRRTQLHHSNAIFDPNNASPSNDFMQTLKQRMSVYYEHEINIFSQ